MARLERMLGKTAFVGTLAVAAACGADDDDPTGTSAAIAAVAVSPGSDTIFLDDPIRSSNAVRFAATATDGRGRTLHGVTFRWTSSDTTVAGVDSTGSVHPVGLGTATIMARSGTRSGSATVAVMYAVRSLRITPASDTLLVDDSLRATNTVRLATTVATHPGASASASVVRWSSSDSTIATVDPAGSVFPRDTGNVTISAQTGIAVASAQVRVMHHVMSASLTPRDDTLLVNDPIDTTQTVRLTASATDWDNRTLAGLRFHWSSSDTTIAVVDSTGRVRARGLGRVAITARRGNASATSTVHVMSLVQRIAITPASATVLVDDSVSASAAITRWPGSPAAVVRLDWRSSDPAVVTVDAQGLVRAVGPGTAMISATGAFVAGTATLSVLPRLFLRIDAGGDFTCGIITLGRAYCWGRAQEGQLGADEGLKTCLDDADAPRRCGLVPARVEGGHTMAEISAGYTHACGITTLGQAYCWGDNTLGKLGNASVSRRDTPDAVYGGITFTLVAAGGRHSCGIEAAGLAHCWGEDSLGQLGNGPRVSSTTPLPVEGALTYHSLSAGWRHTCGLTAIGVAWCWGDNAYGQLGSRRSSSSDQPVAVETTLRFASLSASGGMDSTRTTVDSAHTCAIASGGSAYCWGAGSSGQLGNGAATPVAGTPALVGGGLTFGQLSAGRRHTCGITTGGVAYCWGANQFGQLGNDTRTQSFVPVPVAGGLTFVAISAGRRHTCAIATSGDAYCWGSDILGALGDQLQADYQLAPVRVETPR